MSLYDKSASFRNNGGSTVKTSSQTQMEFQSTLHHHKSYEWHFVSFEFEFLLLQLDDLCSTIIIIITIIIIMIIIIIITLFKEVNTQQQQ